MNVFWNEIAFPFCKTTYNCWNRYVISVESMVMMVACLSSSRTNSTAWWCQAPAVSIVTKLKMWVVDSWLYLSGLFGGCMVGCISSCYNLVVDMGVSIRIRNRDVSFQRLAPRPRQNCDAIGAFAVLPQQAHWFFYGWNYLFLLNFYFIIISCNSPYRHNK